MAENTAFTDDINVAILDLETTGLSVTEDRIIQIAILMLNGEAKPFKLFERYFNPGPNVDLSKSQHIHQIAADVLSNAPPFEETADEILKLLVNVKIIVGHNVAFDFEFLRNEFNRIDLKIFMGESESDETWQKAKKLKVSEHASTKVNEFDKLQFKLLDTFRLALVALPNQKSYSLSALARNLGIQAKSFHIAGYKWGSTNDKSETILHVNEQAENMREHNAITDVLETEKLMQKCLKILNISYADIIEGKCGKFEIDRQLLQVANSLMEKKKPTSNELLELVELAPYQMNVNFPERSICLRDMRAADIKNVIVFLSSRQSHADKRQKLICQGFLQFALDKKKIEIITKENTGQKKQELQELDEENSPERIGEMIDATSCKIVEKWDANDQQKDVGNNTCDLPNTQLKNRKKSRSIHGESFEISNKIARYNADGEPSASETTVLMTNIYEDETEKYEIEDLPYLRGSSFDSLDLATLSPSFTKECPGQSKESQQESTLEADDAHSESILVCNTPKDKTQHGSQEYPMAKETKVTPEKDDKNEEEMKKMRIFSPAY